MKSMLFALLAMLTLVAVGCNQPIADASSAKETAGAEEPVVEGTKVSFHVPTMSCPHGCAKTVEETLAALDGVKQCKVDFDAKMANCVVDPETFKEDSAIAKLAAAGFPVDGEEAKTN